MKADRTHPRLSLVAALAALVVGLSGPATVATGGEIIAGPVEARVLGVIDGDTIVVRARIWLGQEVETRVRIGGVDTPELRGRCRRERRLARQAREFIQGKVDGGKVVLREIQYGKYAGRVVARVQTPRGEDFSTALMRNGLARPYDGARRSSWCDAAAAP